MKFLRFFDVFFSSFRIRLTGAGRRGWSGEIPLQKSGKNNAPWLVKVPISTAQNFVSFWVRVMREDINLVDPEMTEQNSPPPQRILVIFWPLFMVKSMLSVDTTAFEQASEKMIEIIGRGDVQELELAGTHENDHQMVFNMK